LIIWCLYRSQCLYQKITTSY